MKSLGEVAAQLKVMKGTLSARLKNVGIRPTKYMRVNNVLVRFYDAQAVRQIVKYLKDEPIGKRPGPRRGSKRSGKVTK